MRSKICYVGSLGWVVSGVSGFIARGAEFCHSVRSTFLTGCVWRSEGTDDAETWRPYCARLSRCLGDALVVQWLKHSTVNTFFFPQYIFLHVFTSVKWGFIFLIIDGISLSLSARPVHTQLSSYFIDVPVTNHLRAIWGRDLNPGGGLKLSVESSYTQTSRMRVKQLGRF